MRRFGLASGWASGSASPFASGGPVGSALGSGPASGATFFRVGSFTCTPLFVIGDTLQTLEQGGLYRDGRDDDTLRALDPIGIAAFRASRTNRRTTAHTLDIADALGPIRVRVRVHSDYDKISCIKHFSCLARPAGIARAHRGEVPCQSLGTGAHPSAPRARPHYLRRVRPRGNRRDQTYSFQIDLNDAPAHARSSHRSSDRQHDRMKSHGPS